VVNRADFPRLQRLFEKLEAKPAVRFAHAIEQQREAKSAGGFLGEIAFEDALGALKIAA
jgi:glutathione S-transferase